MHSAYETIGVNDMKYLKDLLDTFYTKKIKIDEEEIIIK